MINKETYKRLTAKKEDRYWEQEEFWQSAQEPSYEEIEELYSRLAELEDKIIDGEIGDITELNKFYKELLQERDFQIYKKENFAKQQGFAPDATPYYIALQYKQRAEAAEKSLKEFNRKIESGTLMELPCKVF